MCIYFVVKWDESANTFVMVDCVRKITVKMACNYGDHGSFEHCFYWGWGVFVVVVVGGGDAKILPNPENIIRC